MVDGGEDSGRGTLHLSGSCEMELELKAPGASSAPLLDSLPVGWVQCDVCMYECISVSVA